MKEKLQAFWQVPKNRILILILAALVFFWLWDPLAEEPAAGPMHMESSAEKKQQEVREGVQPSGKRHVAVPANQKPVLKDPFYVPAEYQEQKKNEGTQTAVSRAQTGQFSAKASAVPQSAVKAVQSPVARGILHSGGKTVAILEYAGESREYAKGEKIGPYRVVSIYTEWITLEGPEGTLSLKVGR